MGKLKTAIAEEQVATDMARRLNAAVDACRQNAEGIGNQLQEAMKIDKMKSEHVQLIRNTIFDVVVAASQCIPGGMIVSATLKMFRQKSLASAAWLVRSDDSDLARAIQKVTRLETNSANTYSSVGGGFFVDNASYTNRARFVGDLGEGDEEFTSGMFGQDEHAGHLREQFETNATNAVLDRLSPFSPKYDMPESRLGSVCLSDTEATSNALVRDIYNDGGATLMAATYKRVLGQIQEVERGGASAVLTYALATLAEGMDLGQIGANMANLGGYRIMEGTQPRLALGKAEMQEARNPKNEANAKLNRLLEGWKSRHSTFLKLWTDPWLIEARRGCIPPRGTATPATGRLRMSTSSCCSS